MWSSHLIRAEAHSSKKSFSPAKREGSVSGAKFRLHPQGTGPVLCGCRRNTQTAQRPRWPRPAPEPRQPKSDCSQPGSVGRAGPGAGLPLAQPQPGGYAASGTLPACEVDSLALPRSSHSTPTAPKTGLRAPSSQGARGPSFCPQACLKGTLESQHQEGSAWQNSYVRSYGCKEGREGYRGHIRLPGTVNSSARASSSI